MEQTQSDKKERQGQEVLRINEDKAKVCCSFHKFLSMKSNNLVFRSRHFQSFASAAAVTSLSVLVMGLMRLKIVQIEEVDFLLRL